MEIFLLICIVLGYITNSIWLYQNKPNTYFISGIQVIIAGWIFNPTIGIICIAIVFSVLISYSLKNH